MRKLLLTLPLILGLALNLAAAEDRFEGLNDAQKLALSEAYQAVGEHFAKNGEEKRGADYEETAEVLRNQIADLSAAAAERQNSMQETALAAESSETREVSEEEQKAVGYYFRKLGRALLAENKEKVLSLVDDPFAVEAYLSGVPREKIEADLEFLFDSYDLTGYQLSDLYNTENMSFSYDGSDDVVIVEVHAAESAQDSPLTMALFWKDVQKFYFKKAERGWKLFAIL